MLFYVEYGCSCERAAQVVKADSFERVQEAAQAWAYESYWSYDIQPDPEEFEFHEDWVDACEEDCENDVFWFVETYDPSNELHMDVKEENGIYEI